jgi:hypothetical protein
MGLLIGWLPDPTTIDAILFGLFAGPVLLLGVPLLRASVRMPVRMHFETDLEVPPRVAEYFARVESRLRTEGFDPVATFSVTNLPSGNLNRAYVSAGDPAVAMATVSISEKNGVATGARYVEFVTEFADGSMVTTRSAAASDPFDRMPGSRRYVHTRVSDPLTLKQHHDAHCRPLLAKGPVHCEPGEFLHRLSSFHERWVVYQAGRGLLRRLPSDDQHLGASTKLALRGIATFSNPFAEGFTIEKLLLALGFGIMAPVLAIATLTLPEVPLVPSLARATGLPHAAAFMLCASPILLAAAAAVGFVFSGNAMLWGFLAAYASSRLLLPDLSDASARAIWVGILVAAPVVAQRIESFRNRRASS